MILPRAGGVPVLPRACRALAAAALCLFACAADAGDRLILYFNEDGERVAVALRKLRLAMDAHGIGERDHVRVEHVAVDYANLPAIRRSLRAARERSPAAIVAATALIAQLAREEVSDTPIVFVMYQDPIQLGLAASLRRPGGTMTGLTLYRSDEGKRLELLREIAPRARRLGVLIDEWWSRSPDDSHPSAAVLARMASEQFGFTVEYFQVDSLASLEGLPQAARGRGVDAWYVPVVRIGFDHPSEVTRAIAATGKPAVYASSAYAQGGGLISYESKFEDPFASWAKMLSLILGGFPPGEIPIERPRAFELGVNVGAAREQGFAIPKSILMRATHFY